MLKGFYTNGGGHFWEDVFFYQKWRIQRNSITKKCRLLDNWDICRFEGSFEECRKAFIKYIEAFELPRQKGHMVVMLPGLGESKNIFKPLWREVLKHGFMAAAVNYPSTQKELDGHVRQMEFFMDHLEDVDMVSFVTNGVGSVVLKRLMMLDSAWKKKIKIGRIVEVNPRNHGSKLLKKLSKNKLLAFILGPMAAEMSADRIEKIPSISPQIETGLIYGESIWVKIAEKLTKTTSDDINPEKEKKFEKAKEVLLLPTQKRCIYKNPEVCKKISTFLLEGKF